MRRKPKALPIVQIKFLDHYQSDGTDLRPIPCEVFGRLIAEDANAYYLTWWICDSNPLSHNSETITVVKHPGVKLKYIK